MPSTTRSFALLLLVGLITTHAFGQLPASRFDGLFPAGAAANSTLEVTIGGKDLDDADRLLFSHDGIKATRKLGEPTPFDEGPQPIDNVFVVTVSDGVPPGHYEVRCQGKYGLSNSRTFVIGSLAEVVEVEPNGGNDLPAWIEVDDGEGGKKQQNPATELALPATVNGQSAGGADVDWYRFAGKAGQRVLLDGRAHRIDSRMDMVITLCRADGSVIGESRVGQCGDPLVDATLPADDEYFVKVHDTLYRNGTEYPYRLNVGLFPHLDFVFPPAGLPGSNEEYTVYGCNLPGAAKTDLTVDGYPLEMAKVRIAIPGDVTDKLQYSSRLQPHQGGLDAIEFRVGEGNTKSNPLLITVASAPVVLEQPDNNDPGTAQKLTLPCEVAGQFFPKRDVDWYAFDAKEGDVWAFDLISNRLGLSTDPMLLIQRVAVDDKGEQQITDVTYIDDLVVRNFNNKSGQHEFDPRTTDPSYTFTAAADGTYRVLVKDGHSSVKSDPRLVYRLAIRKPKPDFRIVAVPADSTGSLLLRRGGRERVRIFAFRQDGYDGEIRASCSGLPSGVTSTEIVIGPANTMGTLILTASDDAAPTISTLQVTAKGTVDEKEVTRKARYGAALVPFQFAQPNSRIASVPSRIVDRIQLCVTDDEPAPVLLTVGEGKPLETSRGGILKIPYQVKKAKDAKGNLNAFPIDFPPSTTAATVSIGTKEKGDFELKFLAATPPGTYTFYLAGFNQGFQYRRNPELADKAKERQERIAKILTEAQKKALDLQRDSQKKQTELQAATNALNQATPKKQTADQAVKTAEAALKLAETSFKQKQDAAAANAEDAALKTQATQAQAAVDAAKKKLTETQTAAVDANKKQEEATATKLAAEETKKQTDKELQEARTFQTRAQQEKQRADQFASQKKNEANPRGININVPSNSLTIKIVEFPINVLALGEAVSVKQGQKVEVPVKVARLYDFKASISVQTRPPGGVGGISFQNINIAANKPDGKFEITAQPTATVGEHQCTVRMQMNFNGQNLIMERPLKLTVVEVKPPAK